MKTIRELAEELGLSKTAIRNYMDEEFRAKYTEKNRKGVITISPDGCKLIAELSGKQCKEAESSANYFAQTTANPENVTIPRSVLDMLEDQLRQKDEQLRMKDQQIADLTAAVKSQAQSINADRHNALAGTMKQMLPEETVAEEIEKKPGFFAWLKRGL